MNSISIYPPGCKDIQIELANDELIRRLKVKLIVYLLQLLIKSFQVLKLKLK